MEPIIKFRRVQKRFGPKVIYRNLNLDVFARQTLVVMGGSGVGKSVMLKLLIGLLEADDGSIRFHDKEVTQLSTDGLRVLRQSIAMLFQSGALFDSMSVGDNVAYALYEHHRESMSQGDIDERVDWALSAVDLPGIEEMRPADLSGGMRKRVGLARSIALQPEVILYDEPTTGLDPINITRINRLINSLKNSIDVTSIVVTHDMRTAFDVADQMAMVHQGEIILQGTPDEFRGSADPRVRHFIEGHAPENEDVVALLHQERAR
ncbi:MAG: ATP-binding cassette domain-containing protein [Myxococcota bacterium]